MTTQTLTTRYHAEQQLVYEAFSHTVQPEQTPQTSYGIRISGTDEQAELFDITPNRSEILGFLELLFRNAATPLELPALVDDFLVD